MSLARFSAAFRGKPPTLPLVLSAIATLLVFVFAHVAKEMLEGDLARLDTALLVLFRADDGGAPIGPAWLQEAARDLTALGSFAVLGIVLLGVVGYQLLLKRRGLALVMFAAVLGGLALSTFLKIGFNRPRPDIQHAARVFTASFPSGHAMMSAVTYLTIGALLTRTESDWRAKIYFIVLALLLTFVVGLSRVYLGVHYPSDVLAGWCAGSAWALLCWSIALHLQRRGSIEGPGQAPA